MQTETCRVFWDFYRVCRADWTKEILAQSHVRLSIFFFWKSLKAGGRQSVKLSCTNNFPLNIFCHFCTEADAVLCNLLKNACCTTLFNCIQPYCNTQNVFAIEVNAISVTEKIGMHQKQDKTLSCFLTRCWNLRLFGKKLVKLPRSMPAYEYIVHWNQPKIKQFSRVLATAWLLSWLRQRAVQTLKTRQVFGSAMKKFWFWVSNFYKIKRCCCWQFSFKI